MFIGKVESHSIISEFLVYNHVFEVATFLSNTRNFELPMFLFNSDTFLLNASSKYPFILEVLF